MNFFISNSLSNIIPRILIDSEPFTTSFPTLISDKYCFFRHDLVPNVMNLHYSGHLISEQYTQPLPEKVADIKKLWEPGNVDELHHFSKLMVIIGSLFHYLSIKLSK